MTSLSCRCTVTLNASTDGGRCFRGRALLKTPFCNGNWPLVGTVGKAWARGPCARLNAASKFSAPRSSWDASTGRFCVTLWPNSDPKTPMSYVRP